MAKQSTDGWNATLVAAIAHNQSNFALCYADLGDDNINSIVVSYDGRETQPWGRTDIPAEVTGLCVDHNRSKAGRIEYTAVTAHGGIYYIDELGVTATEQIPDAGYEAARPGRGRIHGLTVLDSRDLLAYGGGNQVYARNSRGWTDLSPTLEIAAESDAPVWHAVSGSSSADFALVGSVAKPVDYSILSDPTALEGMTEEEILAIMDSAQSGTPVGILTFRTSNGWRSITREDKPLISDVIFANDRTIWACGDEGQLYNFSAETEPETVLNDPPAEWLLSITMHNGTPIIASDRRLWEYEHRNLIPIRPLLDTSAGPTSPSPIKVQSTGDVLNVFDANYGVLQWNGTMWSTITPPAAVLSRTFSGLQ